MLEAQKAVKGEEESRRLIARKLVDNNQTSFHLYPLHLYLPPSHPGQISSRTDLIPHRRVQAQTSSNPSSSFTSSSSSSSFPLFSEAAAAPPLNPLLLALRPLRVSPFASRISYSFSTNFSVLRSSVLTKFSRVRVVRLKPGVESWSNE